ncbi:hypothetical protein [Pseudemcibacter aquimaris]|uniref:hypothetical protein n=1 Tax=Pseudemcibacter aquimaris TaxID=2857064 RepID=UPI0020137F2A|nr:hypothetical protein [Pseudemcibacter aquimaris]MCC3860004.1 hypothetical protein [Pseudemcibacter aquimaris]WDU57335.1 hypothetical protein KW060_09000 [Pseudemcibacter aquimaris]
MSVETININDENSKNSLNEFLQKEVDVIIIKDFFDKALCMDVVSTMHDELKHLPMRQRHDNWFYSIDVLPQKVQTSRIFRTWNSSSIEDIKEKPVSTLFKEMSEFQNQFISSHDKMQSDMFIQPQIIHYPKGGGFFDWHYHPRFPVNYGLIVNLSEKNKHFFQGGTEIECEDGSVIKVEEYSNIGDLILFKFDLKHRVASCDPDEDLIFDKNGRWTAVLPILPK